jgi:hypothetical protein
MRLVAFLVSLIFIAMLITATTTQFTVLLLTSERTGFQQASGLLDNGVVADYIVNDNSFFNSGTSVSSLAATDEERYNPVYIVTPTDTDNNGQIDLHDRIEEVNDGVFDIESNDIDVELSIPGTNNNLLKNVSSQSIHHRASARNTYVEEYSGIVLFRSTHMHNLRHAYENVGDFMKRNNILNLMYNIPVVQWLDHFDLGSISDTITTTASSLWNSLVILSGNPPPPAPNDPLFDVNKLDSSQMPDYPISPGTIKSSDLTTTIPVVMVDNENPKNRLSDREMQIMAVNLNTKTTYFDAKEYIERITKEWDKACSKASTPL